MPNISVNTVSRVLAAAIVFVSASAAALTIEPKGMARFDYSFAKCEAKYPEMKGGRDEAYLSMWRVKPDAAKRAQLAAVRKGAEYQAESKRVQQEDAKKAAPSSTLESECRALWGETQKVRSLAH